MKTLHYASYESNGVETYGTAELVNGSGYLFRPEGERTATLVSYTDVNLMLYGLVALADRQAELDGEGIHVRRDNWVSVRYAEELNSGKSSVLLQRADRHGILGEKRPGFQVSL